MKSKPNNDHNNKHDDCKALSLTVVQKYPHSGFVAILVDMGDPTRVESGRSTHNPMNLTTGKRRGRIMHGCTLEHGSKTPIRSNLAYQTHLVALFEKKLGKVASVLSCYSRNQSFHILYK